MRDRFFYKTWIFKVQVIVFGLLALFGLTLGPAFWSGAMTDANYQPRPEAGPPLVIMGCIFLLICALAILSIIARRKPAIRLFREGVQLFSIGESGLDRVAFVPRPIRLFWSLVTLSALRQAVAAVRWEELESVTISEIPMMRSLLLHTISNNRRNVVEFGPAALIDAVDLVRESLLSTKRNIAMRNQLPSWSGPHMPGLPAVPPPSARAGAVPPPPPPPRRPPASHTANR